MNLQEPDSFCENMQYHYTNVYSVTQLTLIKQDARLSRLFVIHPFFTFTIIDGCYSNEFQCLSNSACFIESVVCNGQSECNDDTDEIDCDLTSEGKIINK